MIRIWDINTNRWIFHRGLPLNWWSLQSFCQPTCLTGGKMHLLLPDQLLRPVQFWCAHEISYQVSQSRWMLGCCIFNYARTRMRCDIRHSWRWDVNNVSQSLETPAARSLLQTFASLLDATASLYVAIPFSLSASSIGESSSTVTETSNLPCSCALWNTLCFVLDIASDSLPVTSRVDKM